MSSFAWETPQPGPPSATPSKGRASIVKFPNNYEYETDWTGPEEIWVLRELVDPDADGWLFASLNRDTVVQWAVTNGYQLVEFSVAFDFDGEEWQPYVEEEDDE